MPADEWVNCKQPIYTSNSLFHFVKSHEEAKARFNRIKEQHNANQASVHERLASSKDAAHNKLNEMQEEKRAADAAQKKERDRMNSPINKKKQKQKMKNMRAAEKRNEKLKKAGKGYFTHREL